MGGQKQQQNRQVPKQHGTTDPVVSVRYRDANTLHELRQAFAQELLTVLPSFVDAAALLGLTAEAVNLSAGGRRRDFQMPGYDTPRKLTALGGRKICERSPRLTSLYSSPDVRAFVTGVVDQPIFDCQHPDEFLVLNHLGVRDDTHGWHLDDPSWALVIVLEAPAPGDGGQVEIIRPSADLGTFSAETTNTIVDRARDLGRVVAFEMSAGDAYLIRADKCLHRVAPLTTTGARRTALNLAYEESATPEHAKFLHTTTLMYGDVPD